MPKNLILCIDGTGNTDHLGDDGNDTNVAKIFELVKDRTDAGEPQLKQYYAGVGTEFGNVLQGEVFGTGIDQLILNGYGWLGNHYEEGDRIFLFGFSRGAYAVRSLAGLIHQCGLLSSDQNDEENVTKAYVAYRDRDGQNFQRTHQSRVAKIRCLGVFDTVGALGIPMTVQALLNNLVPKIVKDNAALYEFHDTDLSETVENGFHALALDERRPDFRPVLWNPTSKLKQIVEQVWFAGCHSDVGGGYINRGLASISIRWMAEKATACGLTLETMPAYECHGFELIHDSYGNFLNGAYSLAVKPPSVRDFGPTDSAKLHPSVEFRMAKNPSYVPIARGATRPSPIRMRVALSPISPKRHVDYSSELAALCVEASNHVYSLKSPCPEGLSLRTHSRSVDGSQSVGLYKTGIGSIIAFEGTFTHFSARKGTDPDIALQQRLLSIKDWAENFLAALGQDPDGILPGKIHLGFLDQFRMVWLDVKAWVSSFDDLGEVFITGHSQGGALAVMAGAYLWAHSLDSSAIYTYAAPRAGTKSFVDSFDTPVYRFEYRHDIVPQVPFHRPTGRIFDTLMAAIPDELKRLLDDVNYESKGQLFYQPPNGNPKPLNSVEENQGLVPRLEAAFGDPKSWAADHNLANYRAMVGQLGPVLAGI